MLKPAGLDISKGIITAQYVKDPTDPGYRNDPAYQEWLAWMQTYYPDGDLLSSFNVYAYTVSQTLVHVLEKAGDELTRENIMKQAASIDNLELGMLLSGIKVNTAPDDFFPLEGMRLSRFDGETWQMFGDVIDVGGGS